MAKFTRQHFNAIAETMREGKPLESYPASKQYRQWKSDVYRLADMCYDNCNMTPNGNRSFDSDRFIKACGLEGE